jgi:pyruvate/2-oxoglutarate dehydrogenase complex dihydrolipoamide acyltransferase (E2) component
MTPTNRVVASRPVRGESAYVYAFKARARDHHCLGYGTFDVDLTRLEPLRKQYSRTVAPVTNLALYLKAVGLALAKNPEANAILFRKLFGYRVVRFEHIDVNFPVTRKVGERTITFVGTVRDVPHKTLAQIQGEITHYQRCPAEESFAIKRFLAFDNKPLWLAKLIHAWMTRSPTFYVRNVGTCGLTLVEGGGVWGRLFPIAPTSVVFGLSSPAKRPVVRGDAVAVARTLPCVLMADNFVISGNVAARLTRDFVELLETGSFVEQELSQAAEVPRG